MVSNLQQEVVKEGEEAQKMYSEFAEMCEDRSRDLHNEIKMGKATIAELTATIEKATADTAVSEEKISDFASAITEDEAGLTKNGVGVVTMIGVNQKTLCWNIILLGQTTSAIA